MNKSLIISILIGCIPIIGRAQTPSLQVKELPQVVYEAQQQLSFCVTSAANFKVTIEVDGRIVHKDLEPSNARCQTGGYSFEIPILLPAFDKSIKIHIIVSNQNSTGKFLFTTLKRKVSFVLKPVSPAVDCKIPIQIELKSNMPLKRQDISVWLDNKLYVGASKIGEDELLLPKQANANYTYVYNNVIILPHYGTFVLKLQVKQQGKIIAESAPKMLECKPPIPQSINLHVLSVGIGNNGLVYSKKDAKDFYNIFKSQEGRLYKNVFATLLEDSCNTRTHIVNELIKLKQAYDSKLLTNNDMIMLYFSTHGDNPNGTFYLKTCGYNQEDPSETGVDWEIIQKYLGENVKCKKLLFIDACKSGTIGAKTADPKTLLEAQNRQFQARSGWAVFTSSNKELSWEFSKWENGAFTKGLKEALLDGKADTNPSNKIITLNELFEYVKNRVPTLSLEHPQCTDKQEPQLKNVTLPLDLPLFEVR